MFEFFIRNDFISQNQPGFKPGDSCTNQLLAITHEIQKSFDACLDVRAVFLNISKAFDKVWHQGFLYKLKQNGISGNLLETLTEFLKDRKQRIVGMNKPPHEQMLKLEFLKALSLVHYCF